MVKKMTSASYEESVKSGVSLIDFNAVWCGPCRMMEPVLENLSTKYEDSMGVYAVDVDENNDLAFKFNVESIPTIVIIKNGVEVERVIGAHSEDEMISIVDKHIV